MLLFISPAKKLDFVSDNKVSEYTEIEFKEEVKTLVDLAKKLTKSDLSRMMKLSDKLAELNFHRYQEFSDDFNLNNSKQAIYAFRGDTYVGLDADSLSSADIKYAQKHLRILSGLYGILRPLDLIQAYRLEMGTKFPNPKGEDLYDFWSDIITEAINQEIKTHKNKTVVNLASNEYIKVIDKKKLEAEFITPHFKVIKDGLPKTIGIFAKRARGQMARYIIQNKIENTEDIKNFAIDGYKYQEELSKETDLVFIK